MPLDPIPVPVSEAVELWLGSRQAFGAKPNTLENYRHSIDRFLRFLPRDATLDDVDRKTLLAYAAQLGTATTAGVRKGRPLRPATAASYVKMVFNLLNWCEENDLLNGPNPARGRGIVPRIPREPKRAPNEQDVARLLDAVEKREGDLPALVARNRALLWVMLDTGMRVGELSRLDVTDLDARRGALFIRKSKGGHSRDAFLTAKTRHALTLWIARPREQMLRRGQHAKVVAKLMGVSAGYAEKLNDQFDRAIADAERRGEPGYSRSGDGPLFVDKVGQRLTAHGIRVWLRALCKRAGVSLYRPHDLRRHYITYAAASGMAIPQLMQQVGHSKAETTMSYIVHDEEKQREAAVEHSPLGRHR